MQQINLPSGNPPSNCGIADKILLNRFNTTFSKSVNPPSPAGCEPPVKVPKAESGEDPPPSAESGEDPPKAGSGEDPPAPPVSEPKTLAGEDPLPPPVSEPKTLSGEDPPAPPAPPRSPVTAPNPGRPPNRPPANPGNCKSPLRRGPSIGILDIRFAKKNKAFYCNCNPL